MLIASVVDFVKTMLSTLSAFRNDLTFSRACSHLLFSPPPVACVSSVQLGRVGTDAWLMLLRIWLGGDEVFAPGVLECLADWMDRAVEKVEWSH